MSRWMLAGTESSWFYANRYGRLMLGDKAIVVRATPLKAIEHRKLLSLSTAFYKIGATTDGSLCLTRRVSNASHSGKC